LFSLQTTRLAESFEPLNSSLALTAPEACSRKATRDCEHRDEHWTGLGSGLRRI